MNYLVIPYESIGPFNLGARLPLVELAIGRNAERLFGFEGRRYGRVMFESLGVFIDLKYPDICAAFEVSLPCDPILDGVLLLREAFDKLHLWLKAIDENLRSFDAGFYSLKKGISVYAPDADEDPSKPPESVLVFSQGYYDFLKPV